MPDATLKTAVVALTHDTLPAAELARRLRMGDPSIVTRIQDDQVCIDVRTLLEGDDERIVEAARKIE